MKTITVAAVMLCGALAGPGKAEVVPERIIRLAPRYHRVPEIKRAPRLQEAGPMADRVLSTSWVGTSGNGALATNWSNGIPDDHSLTASADTTITSVVFDRTSVVSITSGLGFIRAIGELTGTSNLADLDEVEIDGKTYIIQATLTDVDGNVQRGASLTATLANLFNAINLTGVPGTDYALAMTLHATFTALNSDATQLLVAFKDGGTTGNGKSLTETSAVASWGAGTSAGGLDSSSSTIKGDIYVDDYSGTVMSTSNRWSGTRVGDLFLDGTPTTLLHMILASESRVVVNSGNYGKCLDATFASGGGTQTIEIVSGRCVFSFSGTDPVPNIIVSDASALSENLLLTGSTTDTGGILIVGPGIVTNDGIKWTDVEVMAGSFVNKGGTIGELRSTGFAIQRTTDVMTVAYILGGDFELAVGEGAKTVTDVWVGPLAKFRSRSGIDNFTLHEIGIK